MTNQSLLMKPDGEISNNHPLFLIVYRSNDNLRLIRGHKNRTDGIPVGDRSIFRTETRGRDLKVRLHLSVNGPDQLGARG